MITTPYANSAAFGAYVTFLSIKRHFTTPSYDFFKYNGKVNASYDSFQRRRDAYSFARIGEHEAPRDLILANILANPNAWSGDIASASGQEVYLEWKQRMDALEDTFQDDLSALSPDYKSNFVVHGGQHPHLLTLFLQRRITLETFAILIAIAKIKEYWISSIHDPIIAPEAISKAVKYRPFLTVDENKLRQCVKTALAVC